ncbi:MAG: type III-A CRISPR-associated protein Cas10/Csm1 [Bifidobacteriaceae bacterium]|jgi:CRISPR-associated protein Csm1|nr:type III-A CRISPR-associated protein Cas10/Csm1 [Bifidobacteriaceae bacterium]
MKLNENLLGSLFGCVLHDVGKPVQRAQLGYKGTHSAIGRRFLIKVWSHDERNPSEVDDPAAATETVETAEGADGDRGLSALQRDVLDAVSYHHARALRAASEAGRLAPDAPAYVSYIADNIAAGADRRRLQDDSDTPHDWQPTTPLYSIFNAFGSVPGEQSYRPVLLDDREPFVYPEVTVRPFDKHRYNEVVQKLSETLSYLELNAEWFASLLSTLEATVTYVPSSTDAAELRDISLFDHLRLTAAFGACIWHYLDETGRRDFKKELFDAERAFYSEQAFALYSFDISGIQDFIYTIHSDRALKTLRARSFYLEMLCEHLIDELVERLALTRANLNYSGGGHAYLLLPNTERVRAAVEDFEQQVNEWLIEHFQTSLFFASGMTPFAAADVMTGGADGSAGHKPQQSELYRELSAQISAKKLSRYGARQLRQLNSTAHQGTRECKVCHRVDHTVREDLCSLCRELIGASARILDKRFFVVAPGGEGLPVPFDKTLRLVDQLAAIDAVAAGQRVYSKNKFYIGKNLGVHLWVGDYAENPDIASYATRTPGIDRLGVLRLDADNLGQAFTSGFIQQGGGRLNTISRTGQFSRSLSLFFRQHINYLLENPEYRPLSSDVAGASSAQRGGRLATIIYSGGDDVFLIGAWNDVLEAGLELRDAFTRYTEGKLTVSAGFGMYHSGFPVAVMAEEVGSLEAEAKAGGKDRIAMFEPGVSFGWDELRDSVIGEKFAVLRGFFNLNPNYGMAFVYKLLELLRERGDQISMARWAYFLARMEPEDEAAKAEFRGFAGQLHQWFQDTTSASQLKAALYLYIYNQRNANSEEATRGGDQ